MKHFKQINFRVSILVALMLLLGFLALSFQTRTAKAESATLVGTVLYDERPVSQFTSKDAVFWVQNETSGESLSTNPNYNASTGEYSIPDMPPGECGVSVFIDEALPLNGKEGFAGDFDGWNVPINVSEGQTIVNQNLTVVKTLHLTSPVDNSVVIGPWSYPEDTYPTTHMTFKWDALAEASSYHAIIDEYEEPSTDLGRAAINVTSDLMWNITLPMNLENHFYVFNLYAYNLNGVMVGKLMVPYSSGYGWDYHFRLVPAPVVESCSSVGDQRNSFDLGGTVYLTGANFSASKTYDLYIVADQVTWTNGMTIPERLPGTVTNVSSDNNGDIPPTAVWTNPQTLGNYDIVVDVNGNGHYDVGIDALDINGTEPATGFSIVPEFPHLIILPLFLTATLLAIGIRAGRSRKHRSTNP